MHGVAGVESEAEFERVARGLQSRRSESTNMTMKRALEWILAIALCGMAFSGYLSYREVLSSSPPALTCPTVGKPGSVLGYPACVYGLLMYTAVAGIATAGLLSDRWRVRRVSQAPAAPITDNATLERP